MSGGIKNQYFEHYYPELFGSDVPSVSDDAEAGVEYLKALREELAQCRRLRARQEDKQHECQSRINELMQQRYDLLTRAEVEEDDSFREEAAKLQTEIDGLDRQRTDALGVANNLGDRVAVLEQKARDAELPAKASLGAYLDSKMQELVDHYRRNALDLVESVHQIRAIQKVMISYGVGNSNGYRADARIPDIIAGDAASRPALLDGDSRISADASNARAEELKARLQQAGHLYGVKYT
jgi:hypothetical protein